MSAAATGDADAAERANCAAVNAMLPTPIQMQDFLALPDDQPIVMVNLLKFKAHGGKPNTLSTPPPSANSGKAGRPRSSLRAGPTSA